MDETIHLAPSKTPFSYHVLLLLLPAFVFVMVLVFIVSKTATKNQITSTTQDQPVLGEQFK